jgi:CRP/FNR family transcriptional regulator, cyclic AMP receptor protein
MNRKDTKFALERLGNIPLFSGVDAKHLAKLLTLCDEATVEMGRNIVEQGSLGYECYVVISGTADVVVDGTVVATLGAGNYFGEMSPIDRQPRSATVTATSEMQLLILGNREFASALQTIPGLSAKLLEGMAARLRDANESVIAA